MAGVEDDQAHAGKHAFLDAGDHIVGYVVMAGMGPPDQHVGVGKAVGRQATVRVLEGRGGGLDAILFGQGGGDGVVQAVGIDGLDIIAGTLVIELVPDDGTDWHGYDSLLTAVGRPSLCAEETTASIKAIVPRLSCEVEAIELVWPCNAMANALSVPARPKC